jgi:hypothetical protein
MIAERRSKRHWIAFGVALLLAVIFVILVASHAVQYYVGTWLIFALVLAALAASLAAELWNPNRDLAGNRARAADLVQRGALQVQPGQVVHEQELERHARPSPAVLAVVGLALLAVGLIGAPAPQLACAIAGWTVNDEAYPPVVGPGDETRIYMKHSISSIKGYWRGTPKVTVRSGSKKLAAKATTNDNSWGRTISAKSSETPARRSAVTSISTSSTRSPAGQARSWWRARPFTAACRSSSPRPARGACTVSSSGRAVCSPRVGSWSRCSASWEQRARFARGRTRPGPRR